jgi:hypothetical protein
MKTKQNNILNQKEKEVLSKKIESILLKVSKLDLNFPYSCDLITKLMCGFIKDNDLLSDYDVKYVRGHYRYYDDVECEEVQDMDKYLFERYNKLYGTSPCANCNCDDIRQHSYIEVDIDKDTFILDFSSYQFHDDFLDWESDYHHSGKARIEKLTELNQYEVLDTSRYYPAKKLNLTNKNLSEELDNLDEYFKEPILF